MNEGGTTLRRPFRDVVFFYFVEGRKSYALYDWRITLQREINARFPSCSEVRFASYQAG